MKSVFYKSLLLAGVFAPAAAAFSLFDSAPSIGVPESYAVRYNAYLNVGYNDNVHQSSRDEESGEFDSDTWCLISYGKNAATAFIGTFYEIYDGVN